MRKTDALHEHMLPRLGQQLLGKPDGLTLILPPYLPHIWILE
jgi:hypothetical protein